ncbi:MAG: hypothetical protein EKK48_28300 [Candidatus Melainabacteria bacterium]|nr:MAG: hypothetical protein EKK48_28300 [Candidatus Melainabacteria bacterium]
MRGKVLSTLCSLGVCFSTQTPVWCEDGLPNSAVASTQPVAAAPQPVAPSTQPVGAAAQSAASASKPTADPKAIEEQLRDLFDTIKKVSHAAQNLQSECNRSYNADAIDNLVMDPWMTGEPGLMNVMPPPFPGALKPLPARKKWIDYDQNQITQLLRILTNEVNALGGAASIDSSIKVTIEILQDNMQQVDEQYARLTALTNPSTSDAKGNPNYDKTAITRTAQALKDEASGMNEIRKRLLRQLKEISKDN